MTRNVILNEVKNPVPNRTGSFALLRMTLIGATFFILHSSFSIQPVSAQACVPPTISCGANCVEPTLMNSGSTCPGSGGRTGTINDCGECVNLGCSGTQRWCNNTCTAIATILTGACTTGTGEEGTRNSCGTCVANGPRSATRQYGSYPGVSEAGFIHVAGDIGSGGDLYLNSGQAIRVDNNGASSRLNFGNYTGTEFHLALHSEGTNLSELILQQGADDRWALSVRPGATSTASGGDFEIRRGATGWPRVLAIDYNTGNVTFDTDVAVTGALTVGGAMVLRQPAGCTNGQVLQWNAATSTWVCAEDAQGAPGVTDHGLLDAASLLDNDHPQYYRQTGETRNLTIGDTLWAYRVFPRTDSLQLGESSAVVDVPGLLKLGIFRDASVLSQTPTTGTMFYKTSLVGSPAGLQVYNGTAWTAVSGTNYTAGDYVTIGADNRISATHDGGCFGPTFVGVTSGSTSGQITSGALAGYRAAHALCNAAFSGSHMCGTQEVLNSVSCGTGTATSAVFQELPPAAGGGPGRAWIANGAPALPTQTNDCNGWKFGEASATVNGVAWQFNSDGGVGWAQTCNSSFPIACCR